MCFAHEAPSAAKKLRVVVVNVSAQPIPRNTMTGPGGNDGRRVRERVLSPRGAVAYRVPAERDRRQINKI